MTATNSHALARPSTSGRTSATAPAAHNNAAADLIDTEGIAAMLGITRAYATNVITKRPDFPPPAVNLSQRLRRWRAAEVRKWLTRGTA